MASVEVKNLRKTYGKTVAVDNVSFTVNDGEFFTLLGPSGCGKTTILYSIAGLIEVDGGEIEVGGRKVTSNEEGIRVDPQGRNMAMVFQDYALYPNMTVRENYAFPLENVGMDKREIGRKVNKTAKLLGLEGFLNRKPADLSGGQKQRVALGRALVREPDVFLLDEPLGNLDARLRLQMRAEMKELQRKLGVTTIYVTHDQTEAMSVSDRVLLMSEHGTVEQTGSPDDLFFRPANLYVANFIGSPPMNFVDCTLVEKDGLILDTGDFEIPIPTAGITEFEEYRGKSVVLGIRPRDISEIPRFSSEHAIEGELKKIEPLEMPEVLLHVRSGKNTIRARVEGTKSSEGDNVRIMLNLSKIYVFDKKTKRIIMTPREDISPPAPVGGHEPPI